MSESVGAFPGEALPLLRCPLCRATFSRAQRSLRCLNGHSYDVARQGYVNLLPGDARPGTADTAEMVAAREAFLAAGHFSQLREFVCEVAKRALAELTAAGQTGEPGEGRAPRAEIDPGASGGCILEVGAGTGYYLAGLLDRFPDRVGLALDISKFAARRAARAHERMAAVVCDVWSTLPVADACAALVVDIFAPRNPAEFRRVLRPDGALLVVTPSPRHLMELIPRLGMVQVDDRKPQRLEAALGVDFTLVERNDYEQALSLSPEEAGALAAMGPSARHMSADVTAERLTALGQKVQVTLSVVVATYAVKRS